MQAYMWAFVFVFGFRLQEIQNHIVLIECKIHRALLFIYRICTYQTINALFWSSRNETRFMSTRSMCVGMKSQKQKEEEMKHNVHNLYLLFILNISLVPEIDLHRFHHHQHHINIVFNFNFSLFHYFLHLYFYWSHSIKRRLVSRLFLFLLFSSFFLFFLSISSHFLRNLYEHTLRSWRDFIQCEHFRLKSFFLFWTSLNVSFDCRWMSECFKHCFYAIEGRLPKVVIRNNHAHDIFLSVVHAFNAVLRIIGALN